MHLLDIYFCFDYYCTSITLTNVPTQMLSHVKINHMYWKWKANSRGWKIIHFVIYCTCMKEKMTTEQTSFITEQPIKSQCLFLT